MGPAGGLWIPQVALAHCPAGDLNFTLEAFRAGGGTEARRPCVDHCTILSPDIIWVWGGWWWGLLFYFCLFVVLETEFKAFTH